MEAVDALLSALVIVALITCATAIWALVEIVRSVRSAKALADDTRQRLIPLLDKLDITIDAVNAELLRVDLIVTKFEDVSDRLSNASDTISDLANVPERIAGGIADKVRSWRTRRSEPAASQTEAPPAPTPDPQDEASVSAVEADALLTSEDQ